MKKILILLVSVLGLSSCLNNDEPNFKYEFLKIDEAITPQSFTFMQKDTITLKYTLPNTCYSFYNVSYEYKDVERIVAVVALVLLDDPCAQVTEQKEIKFPVLASQKEDYVFKFYKGKDNDGRNIFQEVIIPVN